jgi:mono/diheme cytochrome c family protein
VLRGIDTGLEFIAWALVVFFVILLFAGPRVVAEDKPQPQKAVDSGQDAGQADGKSQGGGTAADGQEVFTGNCGSCHTLSAAGTSGAVGPNLDDVSLDAAAVEAVVRSGRNSMPAFEGQLSEDEITAVAEFVAGN